MRRFLPVLALVVFWSGSAEGHGLLIPAEKTVTPLAMLNHQVDIAIEEQVATTRVEQTFRNHTDRRLEATYIFPVPKGASVRQFSMWVNGTEVKGEMLEADKARQIYTSIVRQTQDPGLLEYIGTNLLRMRVFPIEPKSDQKVALSFTSVAPRDNDLVEYIYPLKTDGKATSTLEKFSIKATIKSQHPIQNVYSPTHAIALTRPNDREVNVAFERDQALLDKDFQLFYAMGDKDVGLTALTHRPISTEGGYFMFLISPRVEMPKDYVVPRDMVLVLDTSGSMRGPKMEQARKAMRYCLDNLGGKDRFALLNFATTVNKYRDGLTEATTEQLEQARKWVNNLEPTGGTAIDDALRTALELRSGDDSRTFTIVFFTDGQPTIGETNPAKILKNAETRNNANTRIFTFGVGDDVNATMLDQLAEKTRALSTYVRPAEDIEVKVSSLYSKISHPVLANLKLSATNVSMSEVYPPQLPDLFHGGQLVVLGRVTGKGHGAVTLTGNVGKDKKEFVYEVSFPEKTGDDKMFVEHLWARRKVGYLLDQIRANGEKKELVDETVALAKKYGIATPYTSYLVVPDGPMPVVRGRPVPAGEGGGFGGRGPAPDALKPAGAAATAAPMPVNRLLKDLEDKDGLVKTRDKFEDERNRREATKGDGKAKEAAQQANEKKAAYDEAAKSFRRNETDRVQAGKLGVDLSVQTNNLRNQWRLDQTAQRNVAGRNCIDVGGVWVDDAFTAKMPTVTVKAQSDAYFKLLEKHPQLKDVFRLGNYLVWVTPSGTALIIDTSEGKDALGDEEIAKLFTAKK